MKASDLRASLRVRMAHGDGHYGGGLVSGARLMELIHDVATELCIRHDGDEGLFAGYSNVEFLMPVRAGDFLEVVGEIIRVGRSSREMDFRITRYVIPRPDLSASAADLLSDPQIVLVARGTCVVRPGDQRTT